MSLFLSVLLSWRPSIALIARSSFLMRARQTDGAAAAAAGRTIALGMTLRVVMRHATRYFEDLTWKVGNHGMAL